jgi:hypothetical protein
MAFVCSVVRRDFLMASYYVIRCRACHQLVPLIEFSPEFSFPICLLLSTSSMFHQHHAILSCTTIGIIYAVQFLRSYRTSKPTRDSRSIRRQRCDPLRSHRSPKSGGCRWHSLFKNSSKQCSDCGIELCERHAETCEMCHDIFCPSSMYFHQKEHPKPARAEHKSQVRRLA